MNIKMKNKRIFYFRYIATRIKSKKLKIYNDKNVKIIKNNVKIIKISIK